MNILRKWIRSCYVWGFTIVDMLLYCKVGIDSLFVYLLYFFLGSVVKRKIGFENEWIGRWGGGWSGGEDVECKEEFYFVVFGFW